VIHLGACSDTLETDGDYLLENNFHFSIKLAEWALSHNKRFIYASSAATYGDGSLGFDDDEDRLEELCPLNMYAYSKQLVDLWMKKGGVLNQVVGLKYFNVFGPNEYHKKHMSSMVLKMMRKALNEGVIHLYKSNDEKYLDGGQMRDFIYLKDAVRMSCAFLDPKYRHIGGIYNIGHGEAITWNLLAESLFSSLDKKSKIAYINMPVELSMQYQNYTCAKMDKFQKVFLSEPQYTETIPTESAVKEYVQNYLVPSKRW